MWIMEIIVEDCGEEEWLAIHPTGKSQYEYKSQEEAQDMLDMCYPDVITERKRVREI